LNEYRTRNGAAGGRARRALTTRCEPNPARLTPSRAQYATASAYCGSSRTSRPALTTANGLLVLVHQGPRRHVLRRRAAARADPCREPLRHTRCRKRATAVRRLALDGRRRCTRRWISKGKRLDSCWIGPQTVVFRRVSRRVGGGSKNPCAGRVEPLFFVLSRHWNTRYSRF